jgi:aminopeptidase-like protein
MTRLLDRLDDPAVGSVLHGIAADLYPICRSITGAGVRETLARLQRRIGLQISEVPSGTAVFDWTIPREWTIHDAYVKNAGGERVIDFRRNNLHVVSYSTPVHAWMPLAELRKHIFTLPNQPGVIPYRTSYYAESWGFSMAHERLIELPEGDYEVRIDASLDEGSLTYGEHLHPGRIEDEILLTTHICHPSLANDNCSGLALLSHLAERIAGIETRYSYRFLFAPGTIGAIAWLARNEHRVGSIRHGLVLSGVGDGGAPTYKRSRRGDAGIDRAMAHVLRHAAPSAAVIDFFPYGYDERQFCSPGFDLPVGSFQRSRFGTYPEYHTSADDLDFIRPEHLADSYRLVMATLDVLENDIRPVNLRPKCEPQLGRRGLYTAIGGDRDAPARSMAMLWVLNQADGRSSLLDIAERAGMPFSAVADAAGMLHDHSLIAFPEDAASDPASRRQEISVVC